MRLVGAVGCRQIFQLIYDALCLGFNPAVMQSGDVGLEISRPCLLPAVLLLL